MSMAACVPKLKLGLAPPGKHFVNTDGKCWPESTLYFGVGAWPRVTTVETQKFQATLVAMARNMLRPYFSLSESCHLIAQFVLSSARILSANSAFHIERLKYFRSVVAKASCDLWAILRQEGSWCRSVQSSLQWLHDTLSLAGPPKVQVACWDAAVSFIRDQPLAWKRLVQRGRNLALLRELWDAEVQQYQGMTFRAQGVPEARDWHPVPSVHQTVRV